MYPQLRYFAACSGFHDIGLAPRNPQLMLFALSIKGLKLVFFFVFPLVLFERGVSLSLLYGIYGRENLFS